MIESVTYGNRTNGGRRINGAQACVEEYHVKKQWMTRGAALCACLLMMTGEVAVAEERRLGDYIYVPAMTVQSVGGTISLRVEGLSIDRQSGEPVLVEALPGAEFGVYVISGDGELTPWANPLYPSEQMRIRTGEGETAFTLPSGTEFYLRQESAPQGYTYDEEALIPVTGEAIVVRNEMAGELLVRAEDSLGTPLAGIEVQATDEEGRVFTLITDENGEAVLKSDCAQTFLLRESALPEGVFAATGATGADGVQNAPAADGVSARVEMARRTRVTFEHPTVGSVLLDMRLQLADDNGQMQELPLPDVRLDIQSDPAVSLVTDATGQARASLLEGTYDVRLSYEGDQDVVLPLSQAQMMVSSGSTTVIELMAAQATGRIVFLASGAADMAGGSVSFVSAATGEEFGPYALDAEGMAVSQALPAGEYTLGELTLPQGVELGELVCQEQKLTGALTVTPGKVTQVEAVFLTRQTQTFALLAEELDDRGERVSTPLTWPLTLTLLDEAGSAMGQVHAENGTVTIEALSGEYALGMDEEDAGELGVQPVSGLFALPSAEEAVTFAARYARLLLSSVDENGAPVPGAVYAVTDAAGSRFEVTCDEDGMAVSPALAAGSVTVETVRAPQGHDLAPQMTVEAAAGEASRVSVVHPSYGSVRLSVRMQRLDELGAPVQEALAGVGVALYRVGQDGQQMLDTGLTLVSDEDGVALAQLEPGEYVAVVSAQELDAGCRAPQALRFSVANTQEVTGELTCLDALGGVRVRLTGGALSDEELAQVRFVLTAADGAQTELVAHEGAFYAGSLAAGIYVLRQTQLPAGYTLAAERTVTVAGGEVLAVDVPLEEYAVLSVSRTGLTFDDALKTYVVPLSGQYGVYTLEDGVMKPYPSAEKQATLWANVTPEQMAQGMSGSVKLPASVEGTTYYLRELSAAQGFSADAEYHETVLRAGEQLTVACAVSSDRGFFSLEQVDAAALTHVAGGEYALIDALSGETVLSFEVGDAPYRNPMAVPVGTYRLCQVRAPQGYALGDQPEQEIVIQPYLTQGGSVTAARMQVTRIPDSEQLSMIDDIYAAQEQGLSLVCVDTAALPQSETLLAPVMTVRVTADGGERVNIASLVLSGASDAQGGRYLARVEYCLAGGGWQPSDARTTGVLEGPTAVSLAGIQDDICAVRVTYLNADTLEEAVSGGFAPGQLALGVQVSAVSETSLRAEAQMSGVYAYRTEAEGGIQRMARTQLETRAITLTGSGLFETVCAGRDGRISGIAFFDEDADGVLDAAETRRYAGMTVTLLNQDGDVVDTVRTDTDGAYAFGPLSGGAYRVRFESDVVFSGGAVYSAHVISGVEDTRYGVSPLMPIDGDHTDYIVNAGCIYPAQVAGSLCERLADGTIDGLGGLVVEMRDVHADALEEPIVVVTGESGEFAFSGLLAGEYEVTIRLPEGYLCDGAQDGVITRRVTLSQGDMVWLGDEDGHEIVVQQACAVTGAVRVDDDGDGVIDPQARGVSDVRVLLLATQDSHSEVIRETQTDASGAYLFDGLDDGTYSVLFELGGEWAFTRYGEDSDVYGAVAQSGSTRPITLRPGERAENVDAGVTIPAQLTVSVFKDTQFDGQKGPYEEMLAGVALSLIRLEGGEDAEEITYRTDDSGTIVFAGVSPGEYVLAYQMPGQWRATRQVDPKTTQYPVSCVPQSTQSAGRSEPFTLSMGQSGVQMVIGAMLSGSISGTVYYDDDADSDFGESELPCVGIKAELLAAADGTLLEEAVTAEDGSYAFEGLAPGRYRVRFTAPEGCGFSGTERTMARGGVEPANTHVSATRAITVSAGTAEQTANAGVVRLGALTGFAWEDRDADQQRDTDERGLSGLTVNLMDGAGRTILDTATTDAQGSFAFDSLRPGEYRLRADAPDGYVFSGMAQGGMLSLESERQGRGYTQAFTLLGGAQVRDVGFGLLTQGEISGMLWEDADYDGVMAAGEAGLRGATVELLDEYGQTVATERTIRSGEFRFGGLMPGNYTLRVTLADGYVFTAQGADSRMAQDAQGCLTLDALPMGGSVTDIRIGALKTAQIDGVAWLDQDDDGRRQTADAGVPGVRVTLTMVAGTDAGKTLETVTDETGAYRFDSVMPGSAQLTFTLDDGYAFARNAQGTRRVSVVPMADALSAQSAVMAISAGSVTTDQDVGIVAVGTIEGWVWEDSAYDGRRGADERGVAGATIELIDATGSAGIRSAVSGDDGRYRIDFARTGTYVLRVTLPQGMVFTCEGEGVSAGIDAGIAETGAFTLPMGQSLSDVNVGAIVPASIHGTVLVDADEDGVCDGTEEGLSGVMVTAMQGGTVVATARTDAQGGYAFDMLRPGTYRLRVSLGSHALFTRGSGLTLPDPDAQEGETGEYSIAMGESISMEPVAVVQAGTIAGRAWMDEDASGTMEDTEPAMDDVTVELLSTGGGTIARQRVGSGGRYAFERLRSGSYSLRFTIAENVLFADQTGAEGGSCVPVKDGNVSETAPFALAMGEQRLDMNVGGILPGRIGDTVWLDTNGNGLQDYKEPLIPGVSLTLLRADANGTMQEVATTESDAYGYYRFEALRPGSYVLRLNAQPGDTLTYSYGEPLGEIDSDLDPETGMSAPFRLRSGQTLRNVDVGFTERGK